MTAARTPEFGGERLLLVGTGAIAVMQLPFWLGWLIPNYPDLEVQVVLTRSAEQFVSRQALTVLTHREVLRDQWPVEPQRDPAHMVMKEWCDTVAVYPASLNFVTRLAIGLGDTPALLALQCTSAPICVAPSLPPGAMENPALAENVKRLAERSNVIVTETQAARSASTGRRDAAGAPPLWTVIKLLEERRRLLAGS